MTQPLPDQQVVAAYQQQTAATRAQLAAFIAALWASLGTYRQPQMRDFIAQAVPQVEAAMAHMQSLTAAFLATLNGLHGGGNTPTALKAVTVSAVRNGADPAEVYGRPFHLVWRQLAAAAEQETKPAGWVDAAIQSGLDRATQIAATDLQLAKTHTARDSMARNRNVVGYRRQLEGAHSCALCIVASTRRYHKADLMPMHPACDCQPVPIFGGENVDLNLDPALLEAVHATVAEKFGADSTAAQGIRGAFDAKGRSLLYKDVLITHQHGELGPILGIRGQSFTAL